MSLRRGKPWKNRRRILSRFNRRMVFVADRQTEKSEREENASVRDPILSHSKLSLIDFVLAQARSLTALRSAVKCSLNSGSVLSIHVRPSRKGKQSTQKVHFWAAAKTCKIKAKKRQKYFFHCDTLGVGSVLWANGRKGVTHRGVWAANSRDAILGVPLKGKMKENLKRTTFVFPLRPWPHTLPPPFLTLHALVHRLFSAF